MLQYKIYTCYNMHVMVTGLMLLLALCQLHVHDRTLAIAITVVDGQQTCHGFFPVQNGHRQ